MSEKVVFSDHEMEINFDLSLVSTNFKIVLFCFFQILNTGPWSTAPHI